MNALRLIARAAAAAHAAAYSSAGMAMAMVIAGRSGAMVRQGIGGASRIAMARRCCGVQRSSGVRS